MRQAVKHWAICMAHVVCIGTVEVITLRRRQRTRNAASPFSQRQQKARTQTRATTNGPELPQVRGADRSTGSENRAPQGFRVLGTLAGTSRQAWLCLSFKQTSRNYPLCTIFVRGKPESVRPVGRRCTRKRSCCFLRDKLRRLVPERFAYFGSTCHRQILYRHGTC